MGRRSRPVRRGAGCRTGRVQRQGLREIGCAVLALVEPVTSLDTRPPVATSYNVYRCKICGIESPEPSCFAAIASEGPYRLQGTCITCNQPAREQAMWRRVFGFIALVAGPP